MSAKVYSSKWYDVQHVGSSRSADAIVPLVLKTFDVASVVDVGCGVGAWLAGFLRNGVTDITGLDGDYVNREALLVPSDRFTPHDLRVPIDLHRTFDLAVSLEVAEHLPESNAAAFVASLVRLSGVIMFSAAIPKQGGRAHINEQWPSYWATLFAQHGYRCVDLVRPQVWNDEAVEFWYAQNLVFYVSPEQVARHPELSIVPTPLALVHPTMLAQWVNREGFVYKLRRMVRETLERTRLR